MMSKKTGINAKQFYTNHNQSQSSKVRRTELSVSDENKTSAKKRQMNGFDRKDSIECETPYGITSRFGLNSTEKVYQKSCNFPENSLVSEREVKLLGSDLSRNSRTRLNPLNKMDKNKRPIKLMRGGNQCTTKCKPLDISLESDDKRKTAFNGVKVNMNSVSHKASQEKDNEENDENVAKIGKPSSQTDIRHFMTTKPNSPTLFGHSANGDQNLVTPPKRARNKEQTVTPLLSSNTITNTVLSNEKKRHKISKDLMNNSNGHRIISPIDMKSNSYNEASADSLFNDEQMSAVIESDNYDLIHISEVALDPHNPLGLRNLGNTCYMNSIVQAIFALKFFIEDLKHKFDDLEDNCRQTLDFSMTKSLLNLYNQYNGYRNDSNSYSMDGVESHLSILKECVGQKSSPFKTTTQQDAAEFFGHIIDTVMEEFESNTEFNSKNNPIVRNFEFETGGSLTCKKCKNKTKIENERSHALYLSLPEDNSLQTAFLDFLKDETTAHQCVSALCGANDNILNKYFTKLPKVLFLQLGRYTEDGFKRTEEVIVPQIIYLPVKHNNSENVNNLIAPSPLATPYRSKLRDNVIKEKVSSVKRKIHFEDLDNCQTNSTLNVPINPSDNTCFLLCNANSCGLESENTEQEFLNPIEVQEINGSDETNKANGCQTTPNEQLNRESEESLHSITVENENNEVLNKENTAIMTNVDNSEDDKTQKYQLVAVICHHGTSLAVGHYSCHIYNIETQQWFRCDDNDIILSDFESVQRLSKTSGYCYFYVHK